MLEAVSRSRGFFGSVPRMRVAMRGVFSKHDTRRLWPRNAQLLSITLASKCTITYIDKSLSLCESRNRLLFRFLCLLWSTET